MHRSTLTPLLTARQGLRQVMRAAWVLCSCGWLGASAALAEVEVINTQTPWRAHLVHGPNVARAKGILEIRDGHRRSAFDPAEIDPAGRRPAAIRRGGDPKYGFSPLPPADWPNADFDDSYWPRYHRDDLADFLGDYGAAIHGRTWPALLCLRTCFGIADPQRAGDLKVTVTCLGGGVVYVNGREVGRGFMPEGKLHPLTPAEDYPVEAYTIADGKTPLPALAWTVQPEEKWLGRYRRRVRTFTVNVPRRALVKGRNVVAVELHRAALAGPLGRQRGWSHLGIHQIKLTSLSGAGAIPYAQAVKGTRVWSANAVDQATETIPDGSLVKRNWFWTLLWARGMPVKGIRMGNPFDPVLPVKMVAPRNGVCSGQAVLSDPDGLRGVAAAVGALKGTRGAVIPAAAVQIRYAVQHPGVHYCDALMEKPPDGLTTLPVWLVVQVPKDQAPGWYASTLSLQANGKAFSVPVRVLVTGLTLPDARDFASNIGVTHSADTIAMHYKAEPWSPRHLALMDRSLALLGQVGSDVVYVPVILGRLGGTGKTKADFNLQPMIRWVKTARGLEPDFTILEKYLNAYAKHCAPPRALSLYIWSLATAQEKVSAYEGGGLRKGIDASERNTKFSPPRVHVWDPKANTVAEQEAPVIGSKGSERFWKTLVDGVRGLLVKRGWSQRCILLGLGGDARPGRKTVDLFKEWTPYARWNYLSHFSGDPGPRDGKLIATGGGRIGLKEWPWISCTRVLPASQLEEKLQHPLDFLEMPTARWHHQEYSPPLLFRTLPMLWGTVGRIGLDFWMAGQRGKPRATSFIGSHINALTIPGPDGAIPTVRFQMFREGVQDVEVRTAIIRAYLKLPEDQRKPYRILLDELGRRIAWGGNFLSQNELGHDWPSYVATVHLTAAELAGLKTEATWDSPPR